MKKLIHPQDSARRSQIELWQNAPNPMVSIVKKLDVTHLVMFGRRHHLKFNMLMNYCIGKAAQDMRDFYCLPAGEQMAQYDRLAMRVMVQNNMGQLNFCDVPYSDSLDTFDQQYLHYMHKVSSSCVDRDLSDECAPISSLALIDTSLEYVGGMFNGVDTRPSLIWGHYDRSWFSYTMNISFLFHQAQIDTQQAVLFLAELQRVITELK